MILSLTLGCRLDISAPSPTPGDTTDPETVPGDDTAPFPDLAAIRLNEAVSNNHAGLEDGDGDQADWIEVFNAGDEPVDLDGYHLGDNPGKPASWAFPALTLGPKQFLVVFASGKGDEGPEGELHTSFKLDATGESVVLSDTHDRVLSQLDLPALAEDRSYGISQPITEVHPLGEARTTTNVTGEWNTLGFDDSSWSPATLPAGYDGTAGTGPDENVALFRTTTQSSDGYGYTGAEATDGELSTFSHTGDADLSPWWEVDLGGEFAISSIAIYNRRDCCQERLYNVVVGVENDGASTYTSGILNPAAEGSTPGAPPDPLEITGAWTADHVHISKTAVNGAYSSEWMSLAEVVVMGTPAAPYADNLVTVFPDAPDTVYMRIPFTGAAADLATLELTVDDGAIAWIDGVEIARLHIDSDGNVDSHPAGDPERVTLDPALTGPGEHLLAIEVHSADTDNLYVDVDLVLQTVGSGKVAWFDRPTPDAPNGDGWDGVVADPELDPPRGFYEALTTVTLRSPTPGATLRYTLDGSDPAQGGIDVVPVDGVAATTTLEVGANTLVRARAIREGWAESGTVTHTYLFLDDVLHQPAAPAGWPATWYDPAQGNFTADYAMDPEVVDDPAYHDDLLAGLREIPTLSLVFDQDALFGDTGVYVLSLERGDNSEVPISAELILPDGTTGFAVSCGLRLHGYGWRYHSATLKHAFRLEFSGAYGPRKLEYPFFPDSTATKFDNIVLRAQGSRGFQDFRDPEQADYIRDAFARDTARDMGKVDGHATFVHLYLNGLYWGLYNPVERPDAGFGEEYFGGDDSEYDAINRRTSTNEAIDGDLVAYNEMLALADTDLSDPANYAAIQQYLSVDDLIDYMLIHQYTVNRDGPCCFDSNNMRGVRRRIEGQPFRFFVWDMEYSIWYPEDDTNINVDSPGSISHVYSRLRANDEFRSRYAERAGMHLGDGGALSPELVNERWLTRADEIRNAIVAESARWGDTRREPPYTRDVEWDEEQRRILEEFIPQRTEILAYQLRAAGLLE